MDFRFVLYGISEIDCMKQWGDYNLPNIIVTFD